MIEVQEIPVHCPVVRQTINGRERVWVVIMDDRVVNGHSLAGLHPDEESAAKVAAKLAS
jgi:hypothetical protein